MIKQQPIPLKAILDFLKGGGRVSALPKVVIKEKKPAKKLIEYRRHRKIKNKMAAASRRRNRS